jgi:hypothetical protein
VAQFIEEIFLVDLCVVMQGIRKDEARLSRLTSVGEGIEHGDFGS